MINNSNFIKNKDLILVKFVKIIGAYNHFAAIDHIGRLWTWGNNNENCLAHPDGENILKPMLVNCLLK